MLYIQSQDLGFAYPDNYKNILESVNFDFLSNSKIGLIGKNGCGKSTLLKIILNQLKPSSGSLFFKENIKAGYLSQELILNDDLSLEEYLFSTNYELYDLKNKILKINSDNTFSDSEVIDILAEYEEKDGYIFESEMEKILSDFKLEQYKQQKISLFSGGEKTKIALASVILAKPDYLLLDEPTNHLDHIYLDWLENYLKNSALPYIIISHDRKFLDNCTKTIWEIDNNLKEYSGNYSFYKYQKELELQQRMEAYEIQQKKIKLLESAIQQRRDKAMSFENFKGERSIKKNGGICKRDEGSGSGRLSIKKMMKSAKSVETRMNNLLENEKSKKPVLEREMKLLINSMDAKAKWVLELTNLSKSFVDKKLFDSLNISIATGSKIAITGKNGSGKSTLLNILTGKINDFEGEYKWSPQAKIAYYSQQYENLNPESSILDEVLQGKDDQTFARTILGSLNIIGEKVYQKIKNLSPGEKSKTSLAKIIFSNANVLILDEPTNHLEISAREALEQSLQSFSGTLILVSHDRYFLESLMTTTINLDKQYSKVINNQ